MGRVFQISQGSLSQPPSPGRLGVHKSEAAQRLRLRGSVACASEDRVIMPVYSV